MLAYCGLKCSKCEAFLATRENDDTKRKETAKKWSKMYNASIKPEQVNCEGCKSDGVQFFHCTMCDIRTCCIEKGVENCTGCEEYVCDQLAAFIKLAPEAGMALERLRI